MKLLLILLALIQLVFSIRVNDYFSVDDFQLLDYFIESGVQN